VISVILITKNEARQIEDCLQSVKFADEIIIVDSSSTDQTVEIARKFTDRVLVTTDWPGFGPQKQRALEMARGPWILSIDADERVTPALAEEIKQAIQKGELTGYTMPRLSYVCGSPVRHGGWYPDRLLRLFKKSAGRFSNDIVHEKVLLQGPVGILKNDLLHYSYTSFEQVIEKFNSYSSLGAEKIMNSRPDKSGGFWTAMGRALFAFVKSYFLKVGFLDGKIGFIVAVTSAETAFYKYLKLGLRRRGCI